MPCGSDAFFPEREPEWDSQRSRLSRPSKADQEGGCDALVQATCFHGSANGH